VASLAGIVAHGGVAGAIAESAIVLVVASILLAVWVRERKGGRERAPDGSARLRDDDEKSA
jgi:acyl-coenzyme A thioesterase PaaI-like protein